MHCIAIGDYIAFCLGIVATGTGIGSITFGPLSRFLFDRFGWKNGLLILGIILLNCVIHCAFMKPLKAVYRRRDLETVDLT